MRRQDQQQLVVQADGFVDLLVELPAALNIVRSKPAAHAFVLQVGVEAVGEGLVFGGVADEALHQSQNRLATESIAHRNRAEFCFLVATVRAILCKWITNIFCGC